jgi:enoyl-CoA hydratase/carnithine racemase
MAGERAVLYERTDDGVAIVTLNEPDNMNAWSNAIAIGLFDAYDRAIADPKTKVIIVTGNGRAWSAGADMKSGKGLEALQQGFSAEKDAELAMGIVNDSKGRPWNYGTYVPKPVIAAINGSVAGISFMQALACDFRFAAEGAKFTTAFARRGLIAEGGISGYLPKLVGTGNAMEILLSGRTFAAEEAMRLGLVQRLIPKEKLLEETIKFATDMAINCPSSSMAAIKAQVLKHQSADPETALRDSNRLMLFGTSVDMKEGIQSFVQKRQPVFAPYDPDSTRDKLKAEILQQDVLKENVALKKALAEARQALVASKL